MAISCNKWTGESDEFATSVEKNKNLIPDYDLITRTFVEEFPRT